MSVGPNEENPSGYQSPQPYDPPVLAAAPNVPSPAEQYGYQSPQAPTGYQAPPPYAGAPPVYQSAPQPPYYGGGVQGPVNEVGAKAAKLAMIFGIIGIFVFPYVFGPMAIWQSRKAEGAGTKGTVGLVLGIVDLGLAALSIVFFLMSYRYR